MVAAKTRARFARFLAAAAVIFAVEEKNTPAADGGVDGARRARVVARVGSEAITIGDFEDLISEAPPAERSGLGGPPDAVRHRFLTDRLAPQAVLLADADAKSLRDKPPTSFAIERALSSATLRAIRARVGPASAVPRDAARAYYEKNRTRFDTPVRVRLWRILCATRAEAQSVLDSIHRDPTPKTFGDLARDHSVDHGTSLRAGDLGFLTADGLSREPGLRVDPAVVRAALGVRDGDVVPSPVEEGAFFSVVWRRGTIPALHQTFDEVAAQIQETLRKDRVKAEADDLIASLRAAHLRDLDEARLDAPDLAPTEAPARGTRPDAQVDGGPNSP